MNLCIYYTDKQYYLALNIPFEQGDFLSLTKRLLITEV